MPEENKNYWSTENLAILFDLSNRRIQQLAQENILPHVSTRPYQFDPLPTIREYVKYLQEKIRNAEKDEDSEKAESEKIRADADYKKSRARMAELELKELEGEMHRSEDVEAVMTQLVYTIRSMIVALPGRLAVNTFNANSASEASAIIREECNHVLNELANFRYNPETFSALVKEREGWGRYNEKDDDG